MKSSSTRERNRILKWLMEESWQERFTDNLFVQLCDRLLAAGIPVERGTMHFRLQHPQWLGARILWRPGMKEAVINRFDHGIDSAPQYLMSPANEIFNGVDEVRKTLSPGETYAYEVYETLGSEGYTYYIAWALKHTMDKRHMVSFATKEPGGFSARDVRYLRKLVAPLSVLSEIRIKNVLSRTLLQTYVGPRAAEQILAGSITRGSGATIEAAIMVCDLRDFSTLSNLWPRDDVIEMLNAYFDVLCRPVEQHGGEILKFMGDGMLAIFPLSNPEASQNLVKAITESASGMAALNEANKKAGRPILRYGVGVHVGDVMYGNIGSEHRLDFTVIGPAVNLAARLESLTKKTGHAVLISREFVTAFGDHKLFNSIGKHVIRGEEDEVEVFAINDIAPPA
ncbi:adenylate cyclase [Rhizobium leguminosarum]|uniref:Adenylate cyclase n=1 Tax=Rhizobium leguminosarum TaxID=384 RepID=A0AAE2SX86_RHILE|nr:MULTISPECIES: adenylate/guanylate cyclase domain-containing protein [Rhizobium]MBB4291522.1 adenylate cyclase [Rhizobium leguminosarum]MBB4296219.1 adenylate cyclase [Rhizobium leguminosarum]MBB4308522.1 adenylate cyclase [Rhizobium leguminosarum]MBB4416357.1 adenylate cyclase [Rhizobium leguminosarum]MBB4430676.1 adenylate cyclase [Rhizobium esperanzae]